MLLPHIIAALHEDQRLSPALQIGLFKDRDRRPVESTYTYQDPGNDGCSISIAAPESTRVIQFDIGCVDDDSNDE